ncbi:hypothetical protein FORC31_p283 (plasmid) [Escherichia coli]|nr:hypothetical protein FORC31_p283 [Escherichia coli]
MHEQIVIAVIGMWHANRHIFSNELHAIRINCIAYDGNHEFY